MEATVRSQPLRQRDAAAKSFSSLKDERRVLVSTTSTSVSPTSIDLGSAVEEKGTLTPLAVVGLSFRFPSEATSPEGFWKMMVEKRCASRETPDDRFSVDAHHHPDVNRIDALSIRGGHFMTGDLAAFDAPFFSIGAAEAEAMDPVQRLTLETAYRAIENAGIPLERLAGTRTCVFSGSFSIDYATMLHKDPHLPAKYHATGTATNMQANRVSWFFNLTGPSANIDTACSSSLIALDMVCQSIWSGDSDMGLACGSNAILTPESGLALDNLGMLGKDSRCFSFDHRANGYARGEGFGVLVVKPLAHALRDGDTIRAIIRSSCSNQDGKTPSLTQPSKSAQENLIKDAYRKAGLDMASTRYFEAHGTGTPVGDPIEAGAIGAAFRRYRSGDEPLYVGSVKSNIGHLEGASGVAGVIKTILALEAGVIPPNSNFEKLNPKIDADFLNIRVAKDATPWPTNGLRRASVQSFGFGGANSHIVLDDAYNFLRLAGLRGNHNTVSRPPPTGFDVTSFFGNNSAAGELRPGLESTSEESSDPSGGKPGFPTVMVWSTMDEDGIARTKTSWQEFFASSKVPLLGGAQYINNLAHTLCKRRTHLPWRSYAIVDSSSGLSTMADQMSTATKIHASPRLACIFTGQGSQWYAMGRELLPRYGVYSNSLADSAAYFSTLGCSWNLLDELLKGERDTNINDATYSQPICTALQIALVDLLKSFGVTPSAVVGHSSGEIAAAYCAGALTKKAALKVAYHRGVVARKLTESSKMIGSMMAVGLSQAEVVMYMKRVTSALGEDRLAVACVNSPKSVTISGDSVHIDHLKGFLDSAQVFARKLKVGVAYHSFQMNEVADEYLRLIGELKSQNAINEKTAPLMVSSVTGTWIDRSQLTQAEYWVRNMVSPVLFNQALSALCSSGSKATAKKIDGSHRRFMAITDLLEVGPHAALKGPAGDILRTMQQNKTITYKSMLIRGESAVRSVADVTGYLHCVGHTIDLAQVNDNTTQRGSGRQLKSLTLLPEYAFNHTKTYWHESRISKDYRFRKAPRHDLVGVPDSDWNPLEAKWRNIIKPADIPWIEEHKINGVILYPAAGMLAMAIEATKQLAEPGKEISGFVIKDARFHSALSIPATSAGIEVNMYVQPQKGNDDKDAGWHEFRLYTNDESGWHENCNGSIQIVYETEVTEVDKGQETAKWKDTCRQGYVEATRKCSERVDIDWLYDRMVDNGYGYGPSFRAITSLSHNSSDCTVTDVRTFRWSDYYDIPETALPHVIHPTTFDCILQGVLASYTKGGTRKMSTAIPTYFERVWVSNRGLSCADAREVKVFASTHRVGLRETNSQVVALDVDCQEVLVEVQGFKTTDIDGSTAEEEDQNAISTNLCHNMEWKPSLELLSKSAIQDLCDNAVTTVDEPREFLQDVDFILMAYIKRTLAALTPEQLSSLSSKKSSADYLDWMRHKLALLSDESSPFSTASWVSKLDDEAHVNEVASRLEATNKQGTFYAKVGAIHRELLTGEQDPLSVLFQGDLVKDFYYEVWNTVPCVSRFNTFLDSIAHQNPAFKVLEVGAGTGATTTQLMKLLTTHGNGEKCVPRYGTYDYTDVSPFFFSAAQEAYRDHGSKMRFKPLNIEIDPESQGFECGSYDVVVAAAVLHATADLETTLKHCHKLLKPGGKLILWEITTPNGLRTNFAFGLLEGWWLSSESYRQWGPCIDEDTWNVVLKKTGFSGCDLVLKDYEDPELHEFSVICSTASSLEREMSIADSLEETIIIYGVGQETVAHDLQIHLGQTGKTNVRTTSIEDPIDLPADSTSTLLFLLELSQPVWQTIDQPLFDTFRTLLTSTSVSRSLWLTSSGTPSFRLIDGISRTLNSETDSLRLSVLTLQPTQTPTPTLSPTQKHHISTLLSHLPLSPETEFLESPTFPSTLSIPRLIESTTLNSEISRRERPTQLVSRPWKSPLPLRLDLGVPGLLNTMHFVEDSERDDVPLAPHEIEIEVRAVGLNFRDVLIALGRLNLDKAGCECAGIVTRVGSGVGVGAPKVGDRVAACGFDSYKSFVRVDWKGAARVPDEMDLGTAAGLPVNYCTAWRGLRDIARVKEGESVLVHSAAGGTGQAAVQVAKWLGARVFATVGTKGKRRFLSERYGIPMEDIFSSRDVQFARGIKRLTGGKGVDVVFNSLSGEGLIASWECIAPFGRFIEIGKKDILARSKLQMFQFEHNVSFNALDISLICRDRPEVLRIALEEVFELMQSGELSPPSPLQTYKVSELEKAFRSMQAGKTSGKIVIEFAPEEVIEADIKTRPSFYFDSNATYVIAGGLGGIGRSVAAWFADRGAKHLVLLSRSGTRNSHAQTLIDEMAAKGVQVKTPPCDIGNLDALQVTLKACLSDMPTVKGCIQASMVLRDAAFESMSFESWTDATRSKVQGTWNLHNLLPSGMDFFVMFSSVAGVCGSKGQANYAAGNVFQDALAHHRVERGEKATSLDLGPFFSVGIMTENTELQSRWKDLVDAPVTEADLFALLDYYCDPNGADERHALLGQSTVGLARGIRVDSGSAYYLRKPMFQNLALSSANSTAEGVLGGAQHDRVDFAAVFKNASSAAEVTDAIKDALTSKLAATLSLSLEELSSSEPMHRYGVDSLVAVELRNWFSKELHADIAIFDILGSSTIDTASALATKKSRYALETSLE